MKDLLGNPIRKYLSELTTNTPLLFLTTTYQDEIDITVTMDIV